MANPVCTQTTLVEGGNCISIFDAHRLKALKVYVMSRQLAAIGGTNYTLTSTGTLNEAATAFCGLQADRKLLNRAWTVIEINNAREAGATISEDPDVLAENIECLENFPDWKLNLMELLLRCQLGRADGYPQA